MMKSLIIIFSILALTVSVWFFRVEFRVQLLESNISDIQWNEDESIDRLRENLDFAESLGWGRSLLSDKLADGKLMLARMKTDNSRAVRPELNSYYWEAIQTFPYDAKMWSKYVILLSLQGDRSKHYQDSVAKAVYFSRYEYNSMKSLVSLIIRDWPALSCQNKKLGVDLINRGLEIDEVAVGLWNAKQGIQPMKGEIEQQSNLYRFSIQWARIQASTCETKA